MNGLTNILTTGLLAATMIGIGTAGTAIAATEETKIAEQHNYVLVHEINTTDIYKINGEPCTYEEWIAYLDWIQGLQDGEGEIIIDPDQPVDPDPEDPPVTPTDPDVDPDEDIQPMDRVTFAGSEDYEVMITTEGIEIEWLAVYNNSSSLSSSDYNSYLTGANSEGESILGTSLDDYLNLSCFCRVHNGWDYINCMVRCHNRTSPGDYNGNGPWSSYYDGATGIGLYILHNARVEIVNPTDIRYAMPVCQIIISYDCAYTVDEFMSIDFDNIEC